LAAARDWDGTDAALNKLAEELGASREELDEEVRRRRA
jgi:biotin operon repressor